MQTLVKNIPFLFLSFQGPAGYPWKQVHQQQILVYNIIYLKRQVDPNLFFTHKSSDFSIIIQCCLSDEALCSTSKMKIS